MKKQMHAILMLSLTGLFLSSAYKAMEQTAGYMKIERDAAEASSIAIPSAADGAAFIPTAETHPSTTPDPVLETAPEPVQEPLPENMAHLSETDIMC